MSPRRSSELSPSPLTVQPEIMPELNGHHDTYVTLATDHVEISKQSKSPTELSGTKDMHVFGRNAGHYCLGHEVFETETFRPVTKGKPPADGVYTDVAQVSGRVADLTVTSDEPSHASGLSSSETRLAMLDYFHMPGVLGMQHDIEAARSRGEVSPYYSYLYRLTSGKDGKVIESRSDRNAYLICTQTPDGDYTPRSLMSDLDPHKQDALDLPVMVDPEDGSVMVEAERFLDRVSYELRMTGQTVSGGLARDILKGYERLRSLSQSEREAAQRSMRTYVVGITAKCMDPDFDIESIGQKGRRRAQDGEMPSTIAYALEGVKRMDREALDYIKGIWPNIEVVDFLRSCLPHTFARATHYYAEKALYPRLLDQKTQERIAKLDREFEIARAGMSPEQEAIAGKKYRQYRSRIQRDGLSKAGGRELLHEVAMVSQRVVAGTAWHALLADSAESSERLRTNRAIAAQKRLDVADESGDWTLFTATAYDDIDNSLRRLAKEAIRKQSQRGVNPLGQQIMNDLIEFTEPAERGIRMRIEATGGNQLQLLGSMAQTEKAGNLGNVIEIKGDGFLPAAKLGHYAAEVARTLVMPHLHDERFPSVQGIPVFARFNAIPGNKDTGVPENVPCIMLSLRDIPWGVSEPFLRNAHVAARRGSRRSDLPDLLSGNYRLQAEFEKTHPQLWALAAFDKKGPTILPRLVHEGVAFAVAQTNNMPRSQRSNNPSQEFGRAKIDYGHIPGAKLRPLLRAYDQLRRSVRRSGALPMPIFEGGTRPIGTLEGGPYTGESLFQMIALDGTLYAASRRPYTSDKTTSHNAPVAKVDVEITPHFMNAARRRRR